MERFHLSRYKFKIETVASFSLLSSEKVLGFKKKNYNATVAEPTVFVRYFREWIQVLRIKNALNHNAAPAPTLLFN
jgi:hypothetical protein